jgi:UDP-N-acetylmuramoylalanine--D-glutamate ligase
MWVLEISSFQAELLTAMAPDVAVFLNLSQDHLERHPNMASYLAAKQRLFSFQTCKDVAVLNADDAASQMIETSARRRFFSLTESADGWLDGDRLLVDSSVFATTDKVKLGGGHNLANLLAAALTASAMGAPIHALASTAREFPGLKHRHRTVFETDGVRWIDDSKATNVGAVLAALRGYPEASLHLILGGQGKGQDFSVLAEEIRRSVARLYLIGVDAPAIAAALAGTAPAEDCDTLAEAVSRARRNAVAGQVVLLAPACASFDQFDGFAHRGDVFADLVREEAATCQ